MMSRRDFELLFCRKLDEAGDLAEAKLGRALACNVGILRGSPGLDGRRIPVEEAVSELFLSESEFYRIIDLRLSRCRQERPGCGRARVVTDLRLSRPHGTSREARGPLSGSSRNRSGHQGRRCERAAEHAARADWLRRPLSAQALALQPSRRAMSGTSEIK